jgi:endo-1,4-beta-xylanase
MKNIKRGIIALLSILMLGGAFSSIPAYARLDYFQNWTSDNLNGQANGTSNGRDGTVTFTSNMNTGSFNTTWTTTRASSGFNNLQGLGWATGRANRRIGYNLGILQHTSGHTGMTIGAFYGWTRGPLIEYYVIDNWLNHRSTPGTRLGTFTSDGGTYEVYRASRVGHNIDGYGPFIQLKSVRTAPRPLGQNNTITFQNHVNAWASFGQPIGNQWSYQAYIVEGFESSGRGNATVWELP